MKDQMKILKHKGQRWKQIKHVRSQKKFWNMKGQNENNLKF